VNKSIVTTFKESLRKKSFFWADFKLTFVMSSVTNFQNKT